MPVQDSSKLVNILQEFDVFFFSIHSHLRLFHFQLKFVFISRILGRPRKNYKIIFIKTPTYSEKQTIIPVYPQTEEKTIVYVLSKKPVLNQNIDIPEPPPTRKNHNSLQNAFLNGS